MKFGGIVLILILSPYIVKAQDDSGGDQPEQPEQPDPAVAANKALQDSLGPKASLKPLNSGGSPIQKASDLNCGFDILQACNWGNGGNTTSSVSWGMVDSEVDAIKFKTAFDSKAPSPPFAAAASGPATNDTKAALVSNAIPCQKEDGQLSFGYYLSNNVKLRVCRRGLMDKTDIEPCQEFTGSDPSTVMRVPGGSPATFRIVFIATNFVNGGVAVIKNVKYGAKFCHGA